MFRVASKYLASGSIDKTVKVWDIATGAELRTIQAHEKSVLGVSFEEGGTIISASGDGKAKLFNFATKGRDAVKMEGHEKEVRVVAISADGKTVVSGGGGYTVGEVHVWDAKTGNLKVTLDVTRYLCLVWPGQRTGR